MLPPKNH